MGRGIEGRKIFLTNRDRTDFIARLAALAQDDAMAIYAWALLPNHFHLLCKTKSQPLSTSMRKILTGYVVNFNKRHNRQGHLFQNRYKSIVCQEDAYLTELARYIHLNPLRAGLVKDLTELNAFPWSGHSALMKQVDRPWQDTRYILSFFGRSPGNRKRYQTFVAQGIPLGSRPELVGGGLIRSLGGWAEVLALRRRGDKVRSDQRIVGDGAFVSEVLSEMDDRERETLKLTAHRIALSRLAKKVCKIHHIGLGELRSGSRRYAIVEARQVFSWLALRELGYSGAEVARYLGVTNSCVTRAASAKKGPERQRYIP
jgi:REP element-mobilizing transposase RayT